MHPLKHLHTVNAHRYQVMINCFKVGLIFQGLTHDLSKYSWSEFKIGAKYYRDGMSPHVGERDEFGFSTAWLHHKGRNKHHFEYWIDYTHEDKPHLTGMKMPVKYVVEMFMDRVAASKIYCGKDYTTYKPLEYYNRKKDYYAIHDETRALLELLLKMLAKKGERYTFAFIRKRVLVKGYDVLSGRVVNSSNAANQ